MRSRPANASVICVPIDASWMTGIAISAVNDRYMTKSPIVIAPARIDDAADQHHRDADGADAPATRTRSTAETPVIDCATLRNSRCAPFANTSSSRFSAV